MDTRDPKFLLKKLDTVSDSLRYAAKLNVAFAFVLKNVEDGSNGYCCTHENNTLLERSKLVVTREYKSKITNLLRKTDLFESFTRGPANTNWKLYK